MNEIIASNSGELGEAVHLHQEALYRLACRITRDRETAKDAIQEAFLSALRQRKSFRQESFTKSYLYRIVINKSIDALRKNMRWRRFLPFFGQEQELARKESTESLDELDKTLKQMVNLLPDKFRIPLLLAEYEELPYQEISNILNIPVETVKTRIFRAREKLRKMLGKGGLLK